MTEKIDSSVSQQYIASEKAAVWQLFCFIEKMVL
jgi:hypothetical protein